MSKLFLFTVYRKQVNMALPKWTVGKRAFILKYTSYVNMFYARVRSEHNQETLTEYILYNFCLLFTDLRQLEPA